MSILINTANDRTLFDVYRVGLPPYQTLGCRQIGHVLGGGEGRDVVALMIHNAKNQQNSEPFSSHGQRGRQHVRSGLEVFFQLV